MATISKMFALLCAMVLSVEGDGGDCAAEPALMQLLHWEQSGETLVPVLHEESLTQLSKVTGIVQPKKKNTQKNAVATRLLLCRR